MARQLKTVVIIGFFVAALCTFSRVTPASDPIGDGKLSLYSYWSNESVQVTIRSSGEYDEDELSKVYRIMRCRGNNSVYRIDRRLIDLLDHIQDHFDVDTIEIISGYRSPKFNKKLRDDGHNVARESNHMKGTAVDIHVDEISEEALWKYVKTLKLGGAGIYPCNDFVHVDLGRVHSWQEPDCASRKLVGLDNNPNPDWKITTNKNNYGRGDVIVFTSNKQPSSKKAHLERFHRGEWKKQNDIDFDLKKFPAKGLPFGKYRIVYEASPPAYSNEFYIKKI